MSNDILMVAHLVSAKANFALYAKLSAKCGRSQNDPANDEVIRLDGALRMAPN
jgi:hypothetical protein